MRMCWQSNVYQTVYKQSDTHSIANPFAFKYKYLYSFTTFTLMNAKGWHSNVNVSVLAFEFLCCHSDETIECLEICEENIFIISLQIK